MAKKHTVKTIVPVRDEARRRFGPEDKRPDERESAGDGLDDMRVRQLKGICRAEELSHRGDRNRLIERIRAAREARMSKKRGVIFGKDGP